jgi:signal transduction histidine kinase
LIDELLDLSTIEMGQASLRLEPVALGNVIAKAVEDLHPLASERRVRIVISLPSDLPSVSADPNKLHQIILNLLHNAIKFSPPHSRIDIEVTSLRNGEIQISVRDVGPGLAPEEIEKVFQPFYRAAATPKQAKGAGLGLTIAKLLVELHHGRLWVETTPGEGSCFSFVLQTAVSKQELPLLQFVPIAGTHGV